MLAANVVGFHLFEYARHFMTSCRRLLGLGENVGTGPAGGEERTAGRKRRNLQSRWEGGTGAPGMGNEDGTQPQQGPTKRKRGGSGAT